MSFKSLRAVNPVLASTEVYSESQTLCTVCNTNQLSVQFMQKEFALMHSGQSGKQKQHIIAVLKC